MRKALTACCGRDRASGKKGAEDMQRKRLVEQAFPQHILRPRRANVLLAQLDSGKELCFSP